MLDGVADDAVSEDGKKTDGRGRFFALSDLAEAFRFSFKNFRRWVTSSSYFGAALFVDAGSGEQMLQTHD